MIDTRTLVQAAIDRAPYDDVVDLDALLCDCGEVNCDCGDRLEDAA